MSTWQASAQDALVIDAIALVESIRCLDIDEARFLCAALVGRARVVGDGDVEHAAAKAAEALDDIIQGAGPDCSYEIADLMYQIWSIDVVDCPSAIQPLILPPVSSADGPD